MDIVALGIGIIGIIFLLIGLVEGSKEKIIKQQCSTEGIVVRYCKQWKSTCGRIQSR